jgi:hypothetical protein
MLAGIDLDLEAQPQGRIVLRVKAINERDPSLPNRDFGRVLRANQQKVMFSGAAKSADDPAIARYFAVLNGVSPEIGTRWRSEANSNCRYRFVNNQTTASG